MTLVMVGNDDEGISGVDRNEYTDDVNNHGDNNWLTSVVPNQYIISSMALFSDSSFQVQLLLVMNCVMVSLAIRKIPVYWYVGDNYM